MNRLIPGIPKTDQVFDALVASMQNEQSSVQGSLYITESCLGFYANVFGYAVTVGF